MGVGAGVPPRAEITEAIRPGALMAWPQFVASATGEPLTARYFAAEVGAK